MDFKELDIYCVDHSSYEDELLSELTRQTYLKVLNPRMLSGCSQGLLLKMIVSMLKPNRVLEIGTFTGYSALCMAAGLSADGLIHTIEINDEVAAFAQSFFYRSDYAKKIISHVGDAIPIISAMTDDFQLVFIDGNKRDYLKYYETVFNKVAKGGFIIADNVLWDGHVLDEEKVQNDAQTKGIVLFNDFVKNDPRVEKVMLPLRDGLLLIRKL